MESRCLGEDHWRALSSGAGKLGCFKNGYARSPSLGSGQNVIAHFHKSATSHGMTIQCAQRISAIDLWGVDHRRRESMKRAPGGRHPFFSKRLRRMAMDDGSLY